MILLVLVLGRILFSLGSSLLLAFVPALVVALALQMKTRLKKASRATWKECNWLLHVSINSKN